MKEKYNFPVKKKNEKQKLQNNVVYREKNENDNKPENKFSIQFFC